MSNITYEQIQHLSDRELDALAAERVMGWMRFDGNTHPTDNRTIAGVLYCPPPAPAIDFGGEPNVVPQYSTDISDAMRLAEKVIHGRHVRFSLLFGSHMIPHAEFFDVATGRRRFSASADTPARAITLAAILAAGENE